MHSHDIWWRSSCGNQAEQALTVRLQCIKARLPQVSASTLAHIQGPALKRQGRLQQRLDKLSGGTRLHLLPGAVLSHFQATVFFGSSAVLLQLLSSQSQGVYLDRLQELNGCTTSGVLSNHHL